MALDGIFLSLVKSEIEEKLLGSRVDKIHQPSKEEIIISHKRGNPKACYFNLGKQRESRFDRSRG